MRTPALRLKFQRMENSFQPVGESGRGLNNYRVPVVPRRDPECGDRIKVAVVDAEEGYRWFLPLILDRSNLFRCSGCYASGEEAIREIPRVGPKIVLMDILMPEIPGIECLRRLKRLLPGLIVVATSRLVDLDSMLEALKAGGDDYLIKPFAIAQCLGALTLATRRSGSGEKAELDVPSSTGANERPRLTRRQNQVMRLLAKGFLCKEIPDELGISYSAVHKHQVNSYRKLGAHTRTEALIKRSGRIDS